jgi:hypothetical protein
LASPYTSHPIRGNDFCARAANGQDAAAPPISVMNSRRFIAAPPPLLQPDRRRFAAKLQAAECPLWGQTRKSDDAIRTSALPPTADIPESGRDVRKVPLPDIQESGERGTGRAASSGGSSLRWRDERRRIHVPLFAEARSIASNSVSLKRQSSASRLALA